MQRRTAPSTIILASVLCLAVLSSAAANPGRAPGPATVADVQSDKFLAEKTFWTPTSVYPLGKMDYGVVARMLDEAAMLTSSETTVGRAWSGLFSPGDRVGILLDAKTPPASLVLLDALIDRLVRTGIRPANIVVWADHERALFTAGVVLRSDPSGLRTMGADSEGFRDGVSRIVLHHCDVLINVARLRTDQRMGIWGAVSNQLACVPRVQRISLIESVKDIGAAGALPSVRLKFTLHILDALQPNYDVGPVKPGGPYWNCGRLLMSTDPVALDVLGKQIIEQKRTLVRGEEWPLEGDPKYVQAACDEHHLGQADMAQITVLSHVIGQN